jgi:hypothetical protein
VTSHNKTSEPRNWLGVKVKVIARFGTIRRAAVKLGCHHNSIRAAAEGRCPGIAKKLKEVI